MGHPGGARSAGCCISPGWFPGRNGYLVEFWYAQRMLTRVSIHIGPDNEIECHTQPITDLLPSE